MGAKQSKITAQDKAILDLKLQRDALQRYQKKISHLTTRETEIARELLARITVATTTVTPLTATQIERNRKLALLALRRKKYQESLLAKTDTQLEQLEKLVSSVEFALIQKDIVFGLQQGTQVLKDINAEMGGIEHVEKLMGENEEARAYQEEISEMLGGRMSIADEEDVEDELAALESQVVTAEAAAKIDSPAIPSINMPSPPSKKPENIITAVLEEGNVPVVQQEERQAVLA